MSDADRKTQIRRRQKLISLSIVAVSIVALLFFEIGKPQLAEEELLNQLITMTVTRYLGAAAFIAVLAYSGYRVMNPLKQPFGKSLLFCLPAFLVVVNNMPILSLAWGNAYVERPVGYVLLFAAQCLAVGLFEEMAFRGVVFLSLLESRRGTKLGAFVSIAITSAVFGAVHLVNLFTGSSLPAVLLQVGYSTLIGAMCSVVLMKTANIWLCVVLHAVYNFCGNVVPTLGGGDWWDTPTVIFTAVLAVATTAFMTVAFFKMKPRELDRIYEKK
ncbi:MAG: CPBP family intramembrane metalloprotease [Clostridia bacterium]|nr:CPBP family intramembrane metalloprotease [Clostridia bacterium]